MREALKNAVQSAILFECQLPHQESGLGKSCLSSQNDICFNNTDPQEIAKVIYILAYLMFSLDTGFRFLKMLIWIVSLDWAC